ncbi:NAD-dependent epimerase/dehydratase family protein [Desulfosarcina ovata]|uniref:NDP-sugar dehydratase or epimerase n=1 Tax=Desulfosarcina ovata subsp. ovata TaxID=2752305 RepID=A0A5K8A734_9BACT|nr:NAD(P)-dependent oxidoreductase [Desulfosarcina ovata]BBO88335.1 NDP-sugar dehydratase or epimerase [Desulfosarcina ovata subsp. ovata]
MKYALITGGLGFIGSFIARKLLEEDIVDTVVCLDHYGKYVNPTRPEYTDYRKLRVLGIQDRIVVERGEAKYYSVLSRILNRYRPLYIIHLAALPLAKLDNLNAEEAREGTVESTANMLEVIGQMDGYRPERFVYTSSSMVYGDFISESATEEHPTRPREIYGTMKLAGEIVTQGLGRYYGIPYTIIRPSAVYGPTDMNRRVSQIFIEKAFKGEKIQVNGADEKLDFTYVKDVAEGFVRAAIHPKAVGETFNITYGEAQRLLDFVMCLKNHFGSLQYEITERDNFRPRRGTLSIKKARSLIGFSPRYGLPEGVKEYVEFIRENHPLFNKSI